MYSKYIEKYTILNIQKEIQIQTTKHLPINYTQEILHNCMNCIQSDLKIKHFFYFLITIEGKY